MFSRRVVLTTVAATSLLAAGIPAGAVAATAADPLTANLTVDQPADLEGGAAQRKAKHPKKAKKPVWRIKWKPCNGLPEHDCGVIKVPRDWAKPKGPRYKLALRRVPATGPRSKVLGHLFLNPGGPGGSGIDLAVEFADQKKLRRNFHLVGWDPRGVGESKPKVQRCPSSDPSGVPDTGAIDWRAVAALQHDAAAAANQVCWQRNRAILGSVDTQEVIRDLNAMRVAVGDKKLNYLGYSYGTTIGRAYANRYPKKVRAMVLDGVTSPNRSAYTFMNIASLSGMASIQVLMQKLPNYGERLVGDLQEHLQSNVIPLPDGEKYTRWDLWNRLISMSKNRSLARLPGHLCAVADLADLSTVGCPSQTRQQRRAAVNADVDADIDPITALVNCMDWPGIRPDAAALGDRVEWAYENGGPVAAVNTLSRGSICAGTPAPSKPIPPDRRLRTSTPPLLINSYGDAATGYAGAEQTAALFVDSRFISVDATYHGVFLAADSKCVDKTGFKYLRKQILPSRNVACNVPKLKFQ